MATIENERRRLLTQLCGGILGRKPSGIATMADGDSEVSKQIAEEVFVQLQSAGYAPAANVSLSGQAMGAQFDDQIRQYVERTFAHMGVLRSGDFTVQSGLHISDTAQYAHLRVLRQIAEDPNLVVQVVNLNEFKATIASDYQVKSDVVILREPVRNPVDGHGNALLDAQSTCASATPVLYRGPRQLKILHANVSCKWTFRSDRAQNIRTEAIALIRHRKGPMPHMVVVTAEPLPSRLKSIAIGTGEVDCVYHLALPELAASLNGCRAAATTAQRRRALDDQIATFDLMKTGHRLRDISDLPFDLAI